MELLLIIMDHGRVLRAGLFTFPLFLGALATDILNGLRDRQEVTIDTNPRQFTVDHPIMFHAAGHLAGPTARA
jgi:hypothetical protein